MAAHDDEVATLLLGQVVNFLARLAVGQVAEFPETSGYFTISRSRRSLA